jgi:hypothetical protein
MYYVYEDNFFEVGFENAGRDLGNEGGLTGREIGNEGGLTGKGIGSEDGLTGKGIGNGDNNSIRGGGFSYDNLMVLGARTCSLTFDSFKKECGLLENAYNRIRGFGEGKRYNESRNERAERYNKFGEKMFGGDRYNKRGEEIFGDSGLIRGRAERYSEFGEKKNDAERADGYNKRKTSNGLYADGGDNGEKEESAEKFGDSGLRKAGTERYSEFGEKKNDAERADGYNKRETSNGLYADGGDNGAKEESAEKFGDSGLRKAGTERYSEFGEKKNDAERADGYNEKDTGGGVRRAVIYYEPFLEIKNAARIIFGASIRAVEVFSAQLIAEFFDASFNKTGEKSEDITRRVGYNFSRISARFGVESGAAYFRPLIKIAGKATALTFFYPFAYFLNR